MHSDITYHVLQIIHSKSLPQVVEDSRTILLELEVTGKVLSGGGTAKTMSPWDVLGLSALYIMGV